MHESVVDAVVPGDSGAGVSRRRGEPGGSPSRRLRTPWSWRAPR